MATFSSQYGEDEFLVSRGLVPRRGTFVDVGAGDPVRFSNSHYFEQNGWTGVCVDADPAQVEALRRERSAAVEWAVAAATQGEVAFHVAGDPDYSSTLDHLPDFAADKGWDLRTINVPAQPLDAILEKHEVGSIDLLTIDTEGTELDVCRGLNWRRYRPRVVVIEYATAGRSSQELSIRAYFAPLPYRLVHRTKSNLIFTRSRLPRRVRLLLAGKQLHFSAALGPAIRRRVRLRTRLRELLESRKRDPRADFLDVSYLRHNSRRQEHLASLGLDIAERSVFEVGAGIGDHTSFFLDRGCTVITSDARPENLEILRRRYPEVEVRLLDLDNPPETGDAAEIVYCYGLLYHLRDPEKAIAFMGRSSTGLLLLETCVSPGSGELLNPVLEEKRNPTQAASGIGCRPTRDWVLARLREHFPYAYVTATQPWHPQFPIQWDENLSGLTRSVFVASRMPLESPNFLHDPPDRQTRH